MTDHERAGNMQGPCKKTLGVTNREVGVGAGSLKILAGVLVHRAARPQRCQRLSVLCFEVW